MNFEKLKSGSWRVRKQLNGITYSATFPYKPTIAEAELTINKKIQEAPIVNVKGSFYECAVKYINSKSNILSPSTIRGYKNILKHIPKEFGAMHLNKVNKITIQTVVNDYAATHSPKSTSNLASFILSVVKMFADIKYSITLPQKAKKFIKIPTKQEIAMLSNAFRGTPLENILKLACYGLRRGEIFALTPDDILEGQIIVNKAVVKNDKSKWQLKKTKTTESTRIVYVSKTLTDSIKAMGTIYGSYSPDSYDKVMRRKMIELGIEPFGIHKLRHFYASLMHSLSIPDAYIQQQGGWSSNKIMHSVYTHVDSQKAQEFYDYSNSVIESMFQ